MFRRLFRERRGSVLPTFAIALLPLVATTGAAVDYARSFDERQTVQDALDSAVLAAGKKIGLLTEAQLKTEANNFYITNIGDKLHTPPAMTATISAATIVGRAQLHTPTYFLGIIGLNEIVFDVKATVTLAMGTLEVVMALDNSGSMFGTKMATLIVAANNLTNTLFGLASTSTEPDPVKVGLVPFASSVKVDPANRTSGWMDTTGVAPYNGESFEGYTGSPPVSNNLPAAVNVFSLFDSMNGAQHGWAGCVEERKAPYDVQDDPASTATPATMFVPMFAPDEPDNWTCTDSTCPSPTYRTGSGWATRYNRAPGGSQNHNNYLPDFPTGAGKCSGSNANWTCKNGTCGGGTGATEQTALARTCKYGTPANKVAPANFTVNTDGGNYPSGPNFNCTTDPVVPLSTTKTNVASAIAAMAADGTTNITAGLMWGWRLLSPTAPFTEGRAYTVTNNQKILVLMTDGENTYFPNGEFPVSHYGAWGYVWKSHLGTTSSSRSIIQDKMDERMALACTNIKAAKIKIYTVAFQVTDATTLGLLSACATKPDMAYQSSDNASLLAAFTAIGEDISLLRVSE